jgi:hypothetical protein
MDKGKTLNIATYILLLVGAFLAINYNFNIGAIYVIFIVSITVSVLIDKNIEFPLFQEGGWLKSILWGIGGYIFLTLISSLILQGIFAAQGAGFLQIINATLPVFANLPIFTGFTYVLFIGSIETICFIRLWEILSNVGKSNFKWGSFAMWLSIFIVAGLFAFYHSSAKNLNFISLLIVGIMMVVSLIITRITGDMRSALILHFSANFLAILSSFHALPAFIANL